MTQYRIVQIDHYGYTNYKVQRQGWLFWKDEGLGNPLYDFPIDLRFNKYEEAYEWIMKQQKPKEKIVSHIFIED